MVSKAFLQTPQTIPHVERDFVEWHKGISHYGVWAVVVETPDWLTLIAAAQAYVAPFIHPGYRRVPHITLAACGLVDEAHFSDRLLNRQIAALTAVQMAPFPLHASGLDSFTSAPYLAVADTNGALRQIRACLTAVFSEDNPAPYQPHVTLGLYSEAFATTRVADCLSAFQHEPVEPLLVEELAFCVYETKEIQGPLQVLERVRLG